MSEDRDKPSETCDAWIPGQEPCSQPRGHSPAHDALRRLGWSVEEGA